MEVNVDQELKVLTEAHNMERERQLNQLGDEGTQNINGGVHNGEYPCFLKRI